MSRRVIRRPRRVFRALSVAVMLLGLAAGCGQDSADELIRAGERDIGRREYRAAQINLRNAIRLAPESSRAHRLLGVAFLSTGEPAAAEAAFRKAMALGETADAMVPLIAQTLIRQGHAQRLIDEFAASPLRDAQAQASLLASLGAAWLSRGNIQNATTSFSSALAAAPKNLPARLGMARVAAQTGRHDDALAQVDDVLRIDESQPEAHTLRAQLLLARGDKPASIAALARAVSLDPANPSGRVALASLHIKDRQFDLARTLLDQAPSQTASDPMLAFLRALVAMNVGDVPKAREIATTLRQRAPDHLPTLTLSAEIELRAGDYAAAEALLQKAVRIQPAAGAARELLVATLVRQGRPGPAVEVLQPLLEADSTNPRLLLLAGETYLASGDLSRATEFFERAKADRSIESTSRMRLGQIALTQGEMDRGIDEFQMLSSTEADSRQAEMILVALHLRRQEPDKALLAAEAMVRKQPDNPLGHVLAGRALIASKKLPDARSRFSEALRIQADYLPAHRGIAELALIEGQPAVAIKQFEALLAKKPDDEALLIALAEIQERAGDAVRAVSSLRKAVKAHPQSVAANSALVQLLLRQHDGRSAVTAAQHAVGSNPSQTRLLELLGNTQEATGAGADAVKTFRELARIEPRAPLPWLKLAAVQARMNDLVGAAQSLRQARQAVPDNESIATDLVSVYLASSKPDDALAIAREMQTRRPSSAIGHRLEGDVHAAERKWAAAEGSYRKALTLDAQSGVAAIALIKTLASSGRKAESVGFAKDWIEKNPTDLLMREHLADTATRAKDFRAAAHHYEAVVARAPYSAVALSRYATALAKIKDPRALKVAERAVELAPDSPDALDSLGTVWVERGDAGRGLEHLKQARRLAPSRKDIQLHQAVALSRVGQSAQARAQLQQLWSSRDDFPGKSDIPGLLSGL